MLSKSSLGFAPQQTSSPFHRKIDMWYLHAPDRSVPYEVTMKAVNELYKEG